ncbi:MAG: type IV secretion system DNA-binding domain-containing protein [Patescibacteria group bacterium]|nr:type IV secretion system DNA-binding domain-containing protein [Patescibacteria group bacterium]
MSEITTFAKTNFRGQERVFGIKTDDRRRHFYVVGKTGTGKTTMIQNMAIQDILAGRGVAVVDPHGEFAENLIKSIPPSRINDVIYFNPADQEYPIAFNVMEKVDTEYRHLIASGLVGVFKKIWADSWGPRLEYILRNAILGLLEYPGSTLLGVTRILVDKNYRERVVEKISDPVVKSFWVDEFTKWNERVLQEVISPIQNKVGQFLSSALIRNIVGQTKSAFNIRDLMDEGKVLIMNLSKGRIGEDNSALLGAMMITKIQLAAMARVDVPEDQRRDFYLYVDEFQNFATDSFANILSEARKYHLNLILAHQYIGQLMTDTSTKVRDAVFGNVGTICVFRVGAEDAEFLEKEFEPVFMIQDLVNLPNRHIYIKLMIDGIAGNAFSATTLAPIDLSKTLANEEKVIRITRERYASSREEVEEKIARWSGLMTEKNAVNYERKVLRPESRPTSKRAVPGLKNKRRVDEKKSATGISDKERDVNRTMYPAKCATCETDIEVPFKPDGSRPTFCKDCLKDYQRQQARIQQTQDKKRGDSGKSISGPRENGRSPKTITLRDAARIAPKPFRRERAERPRKKVNLEEVRSLIKESLDSK